jgi:drug/metabolite transporter (DMT)-like permease
MGLTFIFWLKALRYSKTTANISNLVFLSPFLSLFYINFILKEKILLSTLVGLILVVAGIIMQQYVPELEQKRKEARQK